MHPLPSGSLAPLLREHREFLLRTRLHSPSVGGLVPIIPSLFKISAAYLVISRIPPLPSPIRPSTGALLQAPAALAARTLAPPGLPGPSRTSHAAQRGLAEMHLWTRTHLQHSSQAAGRGAAAHQHPLAFSRFLRRPAALGCIL